MAAVSVYIGEDGVHAGGCSDDEVELSVVVEPHLGWMAVLQGPCRSRARSCDGPRSISEPSRTLHPVATRMATKLC